MVATPSAIAAPQRVVASNFFKVVLANVDIFAFKMCSQRHHSIIQMHHIEGYTDLEWPINARNRRNILCACFGHAQTRPEITP